MIRSFSRLWLVKREVSLEAVYVMYLAWSILDDYNAPRTSYILNPPILLSLSLSIYLSRIGPASLQLLNSLCGPRISASTIQSRYWTFRVRPSNDVRMQTLREILVKQKARNNLWSEIFQRKRIAKELYSAMISTRNFVLQSYRYRVRRIFKKKN